jgi:hypothetical protein
MSFNGCLKTILIIDISYLSARGQQVVDHHSMIKIFKPVRGNRKGEIGNRLRETSDNYK